jgi:hypothetical protein
MTEASATVESTFILITALMMLVASVHALIVLF